jgi:hypothetical protein
LNYVERQLVRFVFPQTGTRTQAVAVLRALPRGFSSSIFWRPNCPRDSWVSRGPIDIQSHIKDGARTGVRPSLDWPNLSLFLFMLAIVKPNQNAD